MPFELGRPLGAPNNAAFQHRVLWRALQLLEAPSGPVLEDFPEESPVTASGHEIMMPACPVSFGDPGQRLSDTDKRIEAFRQEVAAMQSWYDMAVAKRGRTTFGASRLDIQDIVRLLCDLLAGKTPDNPGKDMSLPFTVNYAVDDLKAFYLEGLTAQPGREAHTSAELSDWFWNRTVAGAFIQELRPILKKSSDGLMRIVATILLVPAAQVHRRK